MHIALSLYLAPILSVSSQQRIVYAKSNTAQCNCNYCCMHRAKTEKIKKNKKTNMLQLIDAGASIFTVVIYTVLIKSFVQLIIALLFIYYFGFARRS